jgi:hypothetical protein
MAVGLLEQDVIKRLGNTAADERLRAEAEKDTAGYIVKPTRELRSFYDNWLRVHSSLYPLLQAAMHETHRLQFESTAAHIPPFASTAAGRQ